ncbi:uncharacterized protein TM35_000201780 [Trypanosoma theileri]|uniref:Uncharacterized protein n=1 Tax=Trypanosoma theileri TaxID=67003 RepID=A0A1X0NUA2_9TRYP|nr:uncharacterized protein TM35_000201780 [Trypanosoma theileri]ORC87769.1 hypothetical protein TM35_000201780 [Trypanosoma theileri]
MDPTNTQQQYGNTRQTPSSQHGPAASVVGIGSPSDGLDDFDLQLRKDCAIGSVPFSIGNGGLNMNGVVPSPSPTMACPAAMFSSVATTSSGLSALMSNPQTLRCMVDDLAQVISRYLSTYVEPQPEKLSDEHKRYLLMQFTDELQRQGMAQAPGVAGSTDGRWTIDKEVLLSLRNGKDGQRPAGAEVARPHHPFAGYCGANSISPRVSTHPPWIGTSPNPTNTNTNTTTNNNNNNNNTNANNIGRSSHGVNETQNPAVLGMPTLAKPSLTVMTLNKRIATGDVIRPQPQHPRNGGKGTLERRYLVGNTKKVLRSASSAFSECSAGETGEVSSSMSRTTVGLAH